jgi:two-component system, cell cycle response regulator
MSLRGSLRKIDKNVGDRRVPESLSSICHDPNAKVLSMDRGKSAQKESLESALYSALRSNDPELEQILSALEEISNGLKFGALNMRSLDNALQRAASCALRQSLIDREIRSLAVTDELTGLYNRRGFLASGTHQLKLAHRHAENVLLLFCDVDNLKEINDSFGHHEGDLALVRAADALEETFRDSDILARLGGDEFAVLASDASIPSRQSIVPRIEKSLEKGNAEDMRYKLSFSVGVARFDPQTPVSLGELMARADQDMYVHKKSHREVRLPRLS